MYRRIFEKKQYGFSLIELLMVIAILSILFVIIFLMVRIQIIKAQDARARKAADEIVTALRLFRDDSEMAQVPIEADSNRTLTASLATLVEKGYLANNSPLTFEGRYLSNGENYSLAMKMGNKSYSTTTDGNGYYKAQTGKVLLSSYSPGMEFDGTGDEWVLNGANNKNSFTVVPAGLARYNSNDLTYLLRFNPTSLPEPGKNRALMSRMSYIVDAQGKVQYGTGWSLALTSFGQLRFFVCQSSCNPGDGRLPNIDTTIGLPGSPIDRSIKANEWRSLDLRITTNQSLVDGSSVLQPEKAQAVIGTTLSFALYVDGVKFYERKNAVVPPWSSGYTNANIYLSGPKGSSAVGVTSDIYPFVGRMDNFRVSSAALSATEITTLYNDVYPVVDAKTAGLWTMDISPGSNDSYTGTGGSNNAVLSTGATWTTLGYKQGVYFADWVDTDGRAYVVYGQ